MKAVLCEFEVIGFYPLVLNEHDTIVRPMSF